MASDVETLDNWFVETRNELYGGRSLDEVYDENVALFPLEKHDPVILISDAIHTIPFHNEDRHYQDGVTLSVDLPKGAWERTVWRRGDWMPYYPLFGRRFMRAYRLAQKAVANSAQVEHAVIDAA